MTCYPCKWCGAHNWCRLNAHECCEFRPKERRGKYDGEQCGHCGCTMTSSTDKELQGNIIRKFSDAWKEYNTAHDWFFCKKKPVVIKAIQMDKDFKVATKEGVSLAGKAGDYLLQGIQQEVYPCNKEIFEKTYKKVKR